MLKKIFLFSLLFIAVSSFVFSAKKKKAKEVDPDESLETLENYYAELSQTALETADLCYELAMSEFAEKDFKSALSDFKSAFELYEVSEKYEITVSKALEIYFELNDYPEKYEQKFFDLKLKALSAGILASEDARLYLASKKDENKDYKKMAEMISHSYDISDKKYIEQIVAEI